jgi:aspartate carbamoyltransferase catalytic subunit
MIHINDLSNNDIVDILVSAFDIESLYEQDHTKIIYNNNNLEGKVVGLLFFEVSTRTLNSFQSAVYKLGGNCIIYNKELSSEHKGECIEDTIRTYEQLCDLLVIRHPIKGFIDKFDKIVNIPIINAGDGNGEHPSQALMDLFTILHYHIPPLNLILCGDITQSRTIHSLIKLIDIIYTNVNIVIISDELIDDLSLHDLSLLSKNNKFTISNDLKHHITYADVLYMTRIQNERITDNELLKSKKKNQIILSEDILSLSKNDLIVLHPLPRNEEIPLTLDQNPKIKIFSQIKYGIYLRMALLLQFINNKNKIEKNNTKIY